MSYGVTATGFVRKNFATIKDEVLDTIEASIGIEARNACEANGSLLAQIVNIFAEREGDIWELLESIYNNMDPDSAEGVSLDKTGALTGVNRLAATRSTTTAVLTGSIGTTIAQYSKASTTAAGDEFRTTTAITLSASVACGALITITSAVNGFTYRITIDGTNYDYVAGGGDTVITIATALQPLVDADTALSATDNGDGTLTLTGVDDSDSLPTEFTLAVVANMAITTVDNRQQVEAVETGAITAYADDLTNIVTPVSGWTAITNPVAIAEGDNFIGRAIESDSDFRLRRADTIARAGKTTVDAVYAAVVSVAGVTDAAVLDNRTDATDANGLDPHSVIAVVEGGSNSDIADAMWDVVPSGIGMNSGFSGAVTVSVTDSQGISQPVSFVRPTTVNMELKITYTLYSEEEFPSNGEALIETAVLAYADTLTIGDDVLPDRFIGYVFNACAGVSTVVVEVKEVAVGALQTTPFSIDFNEKAEFTAGNTTVTT